MSPAAACPTDWEAYVARRFDALAGDFPKCIPAADPRVMAVQNAFSDWSGLTVLDLGCGSGRYWPWLQGWGASVAGLDISAGSLKCNQPGRPLMVASMSRLPLGDGLFDAVLMLETLQHLPRPDLALAEAVRVLKPGGKMIVIDRNPLALNHRRPWLPNLLIKAIDQRRGLWMYPSDSPVRERWKMPHGWQKQAGHAINGWKISYLESSEEQSRRIRQVLPLARPFFCMIGTKSCDCLSIKGQCA